MNDVLVLRCTCLWLNLTVILLICTELGSAKASLPDLLDLPPNMNNFVLMGSAELSMLFQASLHASWWYPVLLSSQQCSAVRV